MSTDKKCDIHDAQILEIRTEFNSFKATTSEKLDDIIDKLKPQFTHPQITGFLLTIVTIMASIMIYATDVKSDTRNNETEIENLKENIEARLIRIEDKLDK